MKLTIEQELDQLVDAVAELDTGEVWRACELRNIITVIHGLAWECTQPDYNNADILIEKYKIEERINRLADNENNAGIHERYKK